MRASRLLIAGLLTLVLLVPAAVAHTAIYSADNQVRGSVGLLNEPVSTYMVSGLHVCFAYNMPAPRTPINVTQPELLTATLRAPGGQSYTAPLEDVDGNCVTFETPLVLTEPGQYLVDLSGEINGTSFNVRGIAAGGVVAARENITFPASGLATYADLQGRIEDLEGLVADLQNDLDEQAKADDGGQFAPGAPAGLLFVGLAALAMLRRLR